METKIERRRLPLSALQLNSGQIEGVPANPRQWTLTDVEKLAASLKETPELLEMRCPIVVPVGDAFVVLGGNLRLAAAQYNKDSEIDCFVLNGATPRKMKEIAIKDNGSFGKWDFDSLANEWDDLPLNDWGLEVWQPMDEQKLPEELEGLNLTPDELAKLEGEGDRAVERVIITYPKDREEEVAKYFGLEKFSKVLYEAAELNIITKDKSTK